jgi:formylglycine-generating enzyme required for sulfatase activity
VAALLVVGVIVIFGWINQPQSLTAKKSLPPVPIPVQPTEVAFDKSKDCDVCPEMVVIRKGSFAMGSPDTESDREPNEGPVHKVNIAKSFSVGKFEVGYKEWNACATEKKCEKVSDDGVGREDMPVTQVSWLEAQQYITWLSGKTKKAYRFLSEAEWEYVARASSQGAYSSDSTTWAEADVDKKLSLHAWFASNSGNKLMPVGKKNPNVWGLYDIQGNVMEWTFDCWNENYKNAEIDGSIVKEGDCDRRVARGGSWNLPAASLRVSKRVALPYEFKAPNLGFRVARTD